MEPTTNRPSIPACPISLDPLKDPVILDCACRGTVSRKSFATWKLHQVKGSSTKRNPCPNCGRPLQSLKVVPNVPLRELLGSLGLGDEEDQNDGSDEENGRPEMHNGENLQANHHLLSNNTNRGELTNTPGEDSNEPPSAGYWIGMFALGVVASIGVIAGVMKGKKGPM